MDASRNEARRTDSLLEFIHFSRVKFPDNVLGKTNPKRFRPQKYASGEARSADSCYDASFELSGSFWKLDDYVVKKLLRKLTRLLLQISTLVIMPGLSGYVR
jgi:hypothetical protein